MADPGPSATASEFAASEMPVSETGEATPGPAAAGFPPYPPYSVEVVCPSLADAILAGHDIRIKHKSMPPKPSRPPPKMARPRGPKATDVKMSRQANRAYARCLRRHNAILTDRLERISKPLRRNVINFWREKADILPASTIDRLRAMLDADEPFKPDQAYEYFINLRKTKKKKKTKDGVRQVKKGLLAMCADKRFAWARNATVAFARGIQQRLSRPGRYALADGMLRLSNIIMGDLCSYMDMRTPSRRCQHPKAKFMMEMSDKIAVWIDEILCESDDRMLMMDFDEDEDILNPGGPGGGEGFEDDFLNMMAGGALLQGPSSAYLKFTGPMLQAFNILTDSMKKKGDAPLLEYGKFTQSYSEAANELKSATDFEATDYNTQLAQKVNADLSATVAPDTPAEIEPQMKEMVDICSNYLAQHAEHSKQKGKAFRALVKAMKDKGGQELYKKNKVSKTMGAAAKDLENAKGLESNHDDPNLSQEIHGKLSNLAGQAAPQESKTGDMAETLDQTSKYLSEKAVDESERGPAFQHLIKTLEKSGAQPFVPEQPHLKTNHDAASALKSAPGLTSVVPDQATAPLYQAALHKAVDATTPPAMAAEMNDTIAKSGNFLSGYARDRGKALKGIIDMMKKNPTKEAAKRNDYAMNYGEGANEIENASSITPFLPVKDIADEVRDKLAADMENKTPPALVLATKTAVDDCAKYLSQPIALRSKAAGDRYPQNFLGAIMRSFGKLPLFKKDGYGMTFADAADALKFAGPLESDPKSEVLAAEISAQINHKVPEKLAPTVADSLRSTGVIEDAAKHLAKTGMAKGKALKHLTGLMRTKDKDIPLAVLQGYEQTYHDAARRLDDAHSLAADKVDKGAYENVSAKLHALHQEKPSDEHHEHMPGIIEASSKYLSKPFPDNEADKRKILADLMARKGSEEFDKKNLYKVSYKEAGEEIKNAPLGPTSPKDRQKAAANEEKINSVIPHKKLQEALQAGVKEGAAHLANTISGRGEALQEIHDAMKKEGNKEFLEVGKFKKDHKGASNLLADAEKIGEPGIPHPVVKDMAADKINRLDLAGSPESKKYMEESKGLASDYLAGVAVKESGLDAAGLAALSAGGAGRAGAGGRTETQEELADRLEAERRQKLGLPPETEEEKAARRKKQGFGAGGGTEEELSDRLEAERRRKLGLPAETKAERADRLEAERRKRLGLPPETDEERAERRKKQGFPPESEEERSNRLEAERRIRLGLPPETGEERADRLEAERRQKLGLPPETEEEKAARRKRQGLPGGAGAGAGAGGIDEAASTKAEAERRKALGLPPETDEERSDRLEAERRKKLGLPPETEEERADRLEAARRRRLGLPPETAQQRSDRIEAARRKKLGLRPETEEERGNRLEAERRKRLGLPAETPEERLARQKLERERRKAGLDLDDPERDAAMGILNTQLVAKGNEIFYKQPHTELTHLESSEWLKQKPPLKVDKTVRESGDASRLSNKFERKLSNLVSKVTPPAMQDTMQDVVIESARKLAERFVSKNYKTLVKEGLIAEMQKKGNEILIDENGATETSFFAAQRLKKAKSYEASEPCDQTAYYIGKKLDEIVRCRTMARKLTGIMKEHIKEAAAYLSGLVTKPDSDIEAYVALLGEMEVTGDALLIEGDIPKSYKDSAAYLRTLTTYEDQINRPDSSLQSSTEAKLKAIMANVPPRGYQSSHMANAITYATKLLVSYIKLQGEKTEALKFLIERLKEGGSGVLLRHGVIRKSYADGADILEGKNADQLNVTSAEPVVARKIQIKLVKLVHDGTVPAKFQGLIDELIEDTTLYLAVNLLQPRVIQVCKCMKNVFVQCELWCDEILRRVARPCCTCSRHVSAAALSDLDPGKRIVILPDHSGARAPGLEITLKTCPSHQSRSRTRSRCPAQSPTPECPGNMNRNYDVRYSYEHCRFASPPHHDQAATNFADYQATTSANYEMTDYQATTSANFERSRPPNHPEIPTSSKTTDLTRMKSLLFDLNAENLQCLGDEEKSAPLSSMSSSSTPSYHIANTGPSNTKTSPFFQTPTTMFATMESYDRNRPQTTTQARTPIVSTDQMPDWHAMMVSLMWNVQAWRAWIQENIDRTLNYQKKTEDAGAADVEENWMVFQRRVATEALQWRQYNIFSRQLTLRLAMRYKDKRIVSPTRATNQTSNYMKCQVEMLGIIEMFNRWTQWLTAVVQETNSLSQTPGYDGPMDELRWKYFKNKVLEYSEDWTKYNNHLKVCWENKYKTHIADWMPAWRQSGPVWVVSACGVVPTGAVSGGLYDNEMIWVARTTHRCNVLPAALHPSKHCCVVYADGGVHHYTKYQVMCNAEVQWRAWRAGGLGARAVRVAPGTHVGRVLYRGSHLIGAVYTPNYRCHVVIFGRPFAFNCYELLVLKKDESET